MAATDVLNNPNSAQVTSGGTTAPAAGTSEGWSVIEAAAWAAIGTAGLLQFRVVDQAQLGVTANYEVMVVTQRSSSSSWTVTRGAENTTPIAHKPGWVAVPASSAGAFNNTFDPLGAAATALASAVPLASTRALNAYTNEVWVSKGSIASNSNTGDQYSPFATIAQALTTIGATTGCRIHVGFGAWAELIATPPLGTEFVGEAFYGTTLTLTANGTLVDLTDSGSVVFRDIGFHASAAVTSGALVKWNSTFNCVFDGCLWTGQHETIGDSYQSVIGIVSTGNSGDNKVSNFQIANLGSGVDLASATNYFSRGTFSYNYRSVVGGTASSIGIGGGASFSQVTWNGSNTCCDHHVFIPGSSNTWHFESPWFESALVDVEIGGVYNAQANGGPFSFVMNGVLNMAGTNACLILAYCGFVVLNGIQFGFDAANATLSSALSTGGPITSLPVTALTCSLTSGNSVELISGAHTQTFVLSSGASVGATSLAVTSATPNFAYPIGTTAQQLPQEVTINGTNAPYGIGLGVNSGQAFDPFSYPTIPSTWTWFGKGTAYFESIGLGAFSELFSVGSGGATLVNPGGQTGISPGSTDISFTVTPRTAGSRAAQIRAAASQTADLLPFTDNNSNLLSRFNKVARWLIGAVGAPSIGDMNSGEVTTYSDGAGHLAVAGDNSGTLNTYVALPLVTSHHPAAAGQWYVNPLALQIRALAPTLTLGLAHVFFSGPNGMTIDEFDVNVTVIGTASLTSVGVYTINNQNEPFNWANTVAWATLISGSTGTVATTTTGQRLITLGTALVIPANTWFAVVGVEQGTAASTRDVGGSAGATWPSPFGNDTAQGYGGATGLALEMAITGAMPGTFTPGSATPNSYDSGVGIHRSA